MWHRGRVVEHAGGFKGTRMDPFLKWVVRSQNTYFLKFIFIYILKFSTQNVYTF